MRKLLLLSLAAVALALASCAPEGPADSSGIFLNAQWLIARGAPSATAGVDGDLYLDTENTILYVKTSGAWVTVGALRGTDGAGWLIGVGVPSASLGGDGDLYLDTDAKVAYKKSGGAWATLFSLQGAAGSAGDDGAPGAPGAPGADGATWLTGSGDPNVEDPLADVGDLYLDTATTTVYRKETTGWSTVVLFQAAVVPQFAFTPNGYSMFGITYGAGLILAVGEGGRVAWSADGTRWYLVEGGNGAFSEASVRPLIAARGIVDTSGFTGANSNLYGAAYGAGVFVAVGEPDLGNGPSIYASADGNVWDQANDVPVTGLYLRAVTYVNGVFLACGQADDYVSVILRSVDGDTWEVGTFSGMGEPPYEPYDYLRGIAFGAGRYVAVGEQGTILVSADGESWTEDGPHILDYVSPYFYGINYANGVFVAVGYDGYLENALVLVSSDGLEWVSQDLPLNLAYADGSDHGALSGIASGTGGFVAVGTDFAYEYLGEPWGHVPKTVVLTSPNAVSWAMQGWDGYASGVCWSPLNGGLYVVARGDPRGGQPPLY